MASKVEIARTALAKRNGTTLPETKVVAKGNGPVAKGNDQAATPAPAKAPTVACGCGCGTEAKPGRLYLPGHDARHAGQVGRMLAANAEGAQAALAALPPKLAEKATRFASNRANEAKKKEAAAKLRAEMAAELKRRIAEIDAAE